MGTTQLLRRSNEPFSLLVSPSCQPRMNKPRLFIGTYPQHSDVQITIELGTPPMNNLVVYELGLNISYSSASF